jgi:hypothetical protein
MAARKGQKKCTIPLQWQDITFWKHARVIPPGSSLQTLLEANGVTINLAKQKNGKKNAKLYHTHSGDNDFSPTKALARLVHKIQDLHESTNQGTYQEAGQAYQVTNKDIILIVQHSAILDDLGALGFDQTRILRSGGATRLCLEGYNHDLIQHLGRWSSNPYLKYIQPQVAQLSAGASAHMATTRRYHRVNTNTGAT